MYKSPTDTDDSNLYISTDALRADLKEQSVRSGFITVLAQPFKLMLGVGATMVLARLLTPEDFGLIAMVSPLLLFVEALLNFGLETAIVHRDSLNHSQVSSLFWVSLKINLLVTGFMALMAPALAWFYGEARLTDITLVIAIGVLAQSLAFQHESLLKRQMRFGTLTLIQLGSLFAGTVAGIGSALLGMGYWALVFQLVSMYLTKSVMNWLICGWRPSRYIAGSRALADTKSAVRAMISYGGYLSGFRLISRIGRQLDRIIIGYFSGAGPLGLYDIAHKWAGFPLDQVYTPLFDVAVASLSRVQNAPEMYRTYCRKALLPIFALTMPALAFIFAETQNVVLFLLGDQWLQVVPFLQLLSVAFFVDSMGKVTKWLYLSQGETRRQFQWGFIYTPVMVIALAVGVNWDAYGVAMGFTVATCLLTYPRLAFCLKTLPLSMSDFLSIVWRPALASIAAAAVLLVSPSLLPNDVSLLFDLPFKLTMFGLAYGLVWISLPGGWQASQELIRFIDFLWVTK